MLDIHFVQNNPDRITKDAKSKGVSISLETICNTYDSWKKARQELETLQNQRKTLAKQSSSGSSQEQIKQAREIKQAIQSLQETIRKLHEDWTSTLKAVPNIIAPDVPLGPTDAYNEILKEIGTRPTFAFEPKDHMDVMQNLDIIDFDSATKTTGTKFYFLKNEAVLLELALIRYAIDVALKHNFTLFQTPDLAKSDTVDSLGYSPRSDSPDIYLIENEDLCLIGTAEITLGGYLADMIYKHDDLPIRMVGISHCFRKEAGAAGKYSRGLYRVHQFSKVELFSCVDTNASDDELEHIRTIEEEIFSGLGIPFRVVSVCSGDLGAPAYKKYDLEAWLPGKNKGTWGEITSTSNCLDFQSRRLNIRYRETTGTKKTIPHTLNGTAIATSRAMIALVENYQQQDGSIVIPEALRPYTGFSEISKK